MPRLGCTNGGATGTLPAGSCQGAVMFRNNQFTAQGGTSRWRRNAIRLPSAVPLRIKTQPSVAILPESRRKQADTRGESN